LHQFHEFSSQTGDILKYTASSPKRHLIVGFMNCGYKAALGLWRRPVEVVLLVSKWPQALQPSTAQCCFMSGLFCCQQITRWKGWAEGKACTKKKKKKAKGDYCTWTQQRAALTRLPGIIQYGASIALWTGELLHKACLICEAGNQTSNFCIHVFFLL